MSLWPSRKSPSASHFSSLVALAGVTGAAVFGACVPHRDYTPAQIEKLDKLDEVMDVQATIADPQFKKIGQSSYTDADWNAFADLANRLQVTTRKIHQFSKGPEFDRLADQLHAKAEKLAAVASARDAAGASETLSAMKSTCKECHSKFR
jgi:hypothetical protein